MTTFNSPVFNTAGLHSIPMDVCNHFCYTYTTSKSLKYQIYIANNTQLMATTVYSNDLEIFCMAKFRHFSYFAA